MSHRAASWILRSFTADALFLTSSAPSNKDQKPYSGFLLELRCQQKSESACVKFSPFSIMLYDVADIAADQ